MESTFVLWVKDVPAGVAQAPSLADFDSDGDVEVVVPGPSGLVYSLEDDGSDRPGFPLTIPSGSHVSSIALAQVIGTLAPELIFTTDANQVEVYSGAGVSSSYFPQSMGTYFRHSPIVENVNAGSSGIKKPMESSF